MLKRLHFGFLVCNNRYDKMNLVPFLSPWLGSSTHKKAIASAGFRWHASPDQLQVAQELDRLERLHFPAETQADRLLCSTSHISNDHGNSFQKADIAKREKEERAKMKAANLSAKKLAAGLTRIKKKYTKERAPYNDKRTRKNYVSPL